MHRNITENRLVLNINHIAESARTLEPIQILRPIGYHHTSHKMLAQDLCEAKLSWDQSISGELLSKLNRLVDSLQHAPSISVPRCYFLGIEGENGLQPSRLL